MGPSFTLRQEHIDAIGRAYREDFARRLARYFEAYKPDLAAGVDLRAFATSTIDFAAQRGILEEEGITWLATILLSARRAKQPTDWIGPLLERLQKPNNGAVPPEEERLLEVHREAQRRGVVAAHDEKEAA